MLRRLSAAVLILGFVSSACSSSDGGSAGEPTQAPQQPAAQDDSQAATEGEEGDGAAGTGTVTIGDMTWQVVADIDCYDSGSHGAYLQGHVVDDPDLIVDLDAGLENGDQARLVSSDPEGLSWIADGDTTQTSNEGGIGKGTGTFFNEFNERVPGSWEFTC